MLDSRPRLVSSIDQLNALERRLGCPVLARVYAARGVEENQLELDLQNLLSPDGLPGIDEAVALLQEALLAQQHILVVADFDADGATSCALALRALRSLGAKKVSYLVPNRFEYGYGLTPEIVELAIKQKPDLLITVDNGISSIEGVAAARAANIQVLVTDHHLPGEQLPDACAILNPQLSPEPSGYENLAGVGVVFYLMMALRRRLRTSGWFSESRPEPNLASLLDLVALGTVADVVTLDYNNRILVHQGLKRINRGASCPGIQELLNIANKTAGDLQASDLGFAVGPRLNAAGRLDDMSLGIACLLTDRAEEAREYARRLNELNITRREIEAEMLEKANSILEQSPIPSTDALVHCLFHEEWHQGVIGILASRIKELTKTPVVAFAPGEKEGEIKGSARSIKGVHIRDALANVAARYPHLLQKFGGHAMAAGLTLATDNLSAFTAALNQAVHELVQGELPGHQFHTDGELGEEYGADHLQALDLAQRIEQGGPWGVGFDEPLFTGEFRLIEHRTLANNHLKMRLETKQGLQVDAIAFGQADKLLVPQRVDELDQEIEAIFLIKINRFNKNYKLEYQVISFTCN